MALTCTHCARMPTGAYELSLYDEPTCVSHPVVVRCALCARPGADPSMPGWRRWGDSARCPRCGAGAVETQDDARALIPAVRSAMAAVGIALTHRVRVTLADPATLSAHPDSPPGVLGLTHTQWRPGGNSALAIEIAAGLTPTHFGATLAHEIGHAWLAERTAGRLPQVIEEGVCEVFAGAWLKKQATTIARRLRDAKESNPDPVYGDGYRMVRAAVAESGIMMVLDRVIRTGSLP